MKKVLAILPHSIGGRLTTSSLIDGFKLNGFKAVVFDELKDAVLPADSWQYIIGYDFSPVKIKIDNNLSAPCITYFSDVIESPASGVGYKEYYRYLKNPDIFVFYWDRELSKRDSWNYMPHFVNTKIYRDFLQPEVDVLFMGRLDTPLRLRTYLELNKKLSATFSWYAIERHFSDALSRCEDEVERDILKNTYKGFIDNEKDMAKAINRAKIVYNINAQGISSLNYRTFQTLSCKRLIISDKREELDLFRGIIPTYGSLDDLAQKIRYYLDNKEEYLKIVKKSREIIELNHDSGVCVKKMLENVQRFSF